MDEGIITEQIPNAGSVIRDENDFLYYSTGKWCPREFSNSIPCFLAYAPTELINLPEAKSIEVQGRKFTKVFNQGIDVFHEIYNQYEVPYDRRFGKIGFIKNGSYQLAFSPASISDVLERQPLIGEKTLRLLEYLEILGLSGDVSIGGSLLLNQSNQKRYDIDLKFEGTTLSITAWMKIQEGIKSGTLTRPGNRFFLPFIFEEVIFDPQFALSNTDYNPFQDFALDESPTLNSSVQEFTVTGNDRSIFFPVVYDTNHGPIVSFRPGQRGIFNVGQTINFDSPLPNYEITWANGLSQHCYLVNNDQYGY